MCVLGGGGGAVFDRAIMPKFKKDVVENQFLDVCKYFSGCIKKKKIE